MATASMIVVTDDALVLVRDSAILLKVSPKQD